MTTEDRLVYWKRRCRDAERRLEYEQEHSEGTRQWALNAFTEERRLRERLTFVYGVARAHGATVQELSGDDPS